jgi:hypothetical protein
LADSITQPEFIDPSREIRKNKAEPKPFKKKKSGEGAMREGKIQL